MELLKDASVHTVVGEKVLPLGLEREFLVREIGVHFKFRGLLD